MVEIRAEREPLKEVARPRVRPSPLLARKWKGKRGGEGRSVRYLPTVIARTGRVATTAAVKITVIIFGGLLGSCLKV